MFDFNKELHQSDLNTYLICPMKFYYNNIVDVEPDFLNPKAIHGSVIHHLIHNYHFGNYNSILNDFTNFESLIAGEYHRLFCLLSNGAELKWNDHDSQLFNFVSDATIIFKSYILDSFNDLSNIKNIYSEIPFKLRILNFDFAGTIDQIRILNNGDVHLIDFKTSVDYPTPLFLFMGIQLNLYSFALKYGTLFDNYDNIINLGVLPNNVYYYKLSDYIPYKRKTTITNNLENKTGDYRNWISAFKDNDKYIIPPNVNKGPVRYEKNLPNYNFFKADILKIARCIKNNVFYRRTDLFNSPCNFCNHTSICQSDYTTKTKSKSIKINKLNNLIKE